MMGSGKSTIAKKLAERLNREALDLDSRIEERSGMSISAIFEKQGEKEFRDRETQALAEVAGRRKYVVATGGGVVLRRQNRAIMNNDGLVIYLDLPEEILIERVSRKTHRPLLADADDIGKCMRDILTARLDLYRTSADLIIESNSASAEEVVEQILTKLDENGNN